MFQDHHPAVVYPHIPCMLNFWGSHLNLVGRQCSGPYNSYNNVIVVLCYVVQAGTIVWVPIYFQEEIPLKILFFHHSGIVERILCTKDVRPKLLSLRKMCCKSNDWSDDSLIAIQNRHSECKIAYVYQCMFHYTQCMLLVCDYRLLMLYCAYKQHLKQKILD